MFEGIGAAQWLGSALFGAMVAALIALVPHPRLRPALLLIWLLAPGLVLAGTSSVVDLGGFLLMFLFLQLFPGLGWVMVALPAFLLARMIAKRHRAAA
ncbi:hypothetical protein [Sphingosinicella terrae]|uniref:hypothetical protein n=1 Tax=Sphingosinicella terrae TaxID=2172047 RepID=UPI000E0CE024|nr:hypothetical protein [Sphingosinicella terrae]